MSASSLHSAHGASRRDSQLGVCSWSLQPESVDDLLRKVGATGLGAVQLELEPLRSGAWDLATTRERLMGARVQTLSGMLSMAGEDYSSLESIRVTGGVRCDATWETNRAAAADCARIARELDLDLVSFHAGFLPHDPQDAESAVLLSRVGEVVDAFADEGVHVALETGQESAEVLSEFLLRLDRPTVGVNFDPANMLLYGMGDPVQALEHLAVFVRQVHLKDARRSELPEQWGQEVPLGAGEVDWPAFFAVLQARLPSVNLLIEREAGDDRVADVCTARDVALRHGGLAPRVSP